MNFSNMESNMEQGEWVRKALYDLYLKVWEEESVPVK